jgi:hypothetical protein
MGSSPVTIVGDRRVVNRLGRRMTPETTLSAIRTQRANLVPRVGDLDDPGQGAQVHSVFASSPMTTHVSGATQPVAVNLSTSGTSNAPLRVSSLMTP